jgi:hypothetical protein
MQQNAYQQGASGGVNIQLIGTDLTFIEKISAV